MSVARTGLVAMSALLAGTAYAQTSPGNNAIAIFEPGFAVPPVAGAPYSADQATERTQTLADGTHITQAARTEHIFRDSLGRTRIEVSLGPPNTQPGPIIIQIQDPVAGVQYTLDVQNKLAHRRAMPPLQPQASPNAGLNASLNAGPPAPEVTSEKLGTQTIEGVAAEGTRTTTTWPVGAQGNDRPMTDTSETWYSQELHATLLSKSSSLRNGDSITRMTNITRAEPDPGLFQPPPDYTMVDEPVH